MNVVGLDLSLTAVGFCHMDGRTETLSSKQRGMERITDLRGQIVERIFPSERIVDPSGLLADLRFGPTPDLVVIEDYAFSRGNHAHEIGELGGVVKFTLTTWHWPKPYVLLGPSALKKFATGKGNADKIAMAVAAAKLGQEFADDNQCDAWWLRQMALYRYDLADAPVTAYRDEAVSKVDWPAIDKAEPCSA